MIGQVLDLLQHIDAMDTHVSLTSKEMLVFLLSMIKPEDLQREQD